jgi:spore coat protein U-like protein
MRGLRTVLMGFTMSIVAASCVVPSSAASPVAFSPSTGATITPCRIDAQRIEFGNSDHHSGTTVPVELAITCPAGYRYDISLIQSSQCGSARSLVRGNSVIRYVISTPDNDGIWCDGTNGTSEVASIGTGLPQYFLASATILSSDSSARIADGRYADSITIEIGDQ